MLLRECPDAGCQVHDLVLVDLDLAILVRCLVVPDNITAQFAHDRDHLIILGLVGGDDVAFIIDCLIVKIVIFVEF